MKLLYRLSAIALRRSLGGKIVKAIWWRKVAHSSVAYGLKGLKNSVLKLMAASILADDPCTIESVPELLDVEVMIELLEALGLSVIYDRLGETMKIMPAETLTCEAPYSIIQKMRASFLVMGPLLAKKRIAKVSMPGGCDIGARPIDLHLKGFQALGAEVTLGHGYIEAKADEGLVGAEIYLDFPSVGATENIMMAATMAQGQTVIQNAAKEPEIVDLANFLNEMGANVRGAGTDTIRISGVEKLTGARASRPFQIELSRRLTWWQLQLRKVILPSKMSSQAMLSQ